MTISRNLRTKGLHLNDKDEVKIEPILIRRQNPITLIGVQGNSGNAAATALAPASFVHLPIPTKNSLPKIDFFKNLVQFLITSLYVESYIPVNRTSPPSRVADLSAISIIGRSSSFLNTALIVSV